jgi:uncharacterized protein YprB with RNaseH-like and TPR domain
MTRALAVDIETVPTTDGVDFDDPTVWEIFAIAAGFRSGHASPVQSAVFVREDDTRRDERKLLAQLTNWVRDHDPIDVVLTYNGGEFDLPVIAERADAVMCSDIYHEGTLSFALYDALDVPHRDLFVEVREDMPDDEKWPTLDEALTERGIQVGEPELDGEPVVGMDMPDLGRSVLDGSIIAKEREAVVQYAESDVRPLFELADALDRERRSEAEADAATDGGQR